MEIIVDEVTPGDSIRGRLAGAASGGVDIRVDAAMRSPFDERWNHWASVRTVGDRFEVRAPMYPPSWDGELLGVTWVIEATDSSGERAREVIEIDRRDVTIESPANDDLESPAKPFSWKTPIIAGLVFAAAVTCLVVGIVRASAGLITLGGFAMFFSGIPLLGSLWGARERSVLGHVRCRVEPEEDVLRCVVRAHPPKGAVPDGTSVTATLIIAEMATRTNLDRGPSEREAVVASEEIVLAEHAPNEWRGSIPLDATRSAPLSRHRRDDDITYAVSWVVKLAIDPPRLPAFVRPQPLLTLPTGLDPSVRPGFVDVPQAAR